MIGADEKADITRRQAELHNRRNNSLGEYFIVWFYFPFLMFLLLFIGAVRVVEIVVQLSPSFVSKKIEIFERRLGALYL
jgi:succinate-acetate transporter protein